MPGSPLADAAPMQLSADCEACDGRPLPPLVALSVIAGLSGGLWLLVWRVGRSLLGT